MAPQRDEPASNHSLIIRERRLRHSRLVALVKSQYLTQQLIVTCSLSSNIIEEGTQQGKVSGLYHNVLKDRAL